MNDTSVKRLAIFAHYDKGNIVDDYVYYYLSALAEICTKVHCVSTSALSLDSQAKLRNMGIQLTCRPNVGYDFMSYKFGLDSHDLKQYDEVVICNDSVYGPLTPLKNLFTADNVCDCDFWGITDSYLTAHHIQSYFVVFKRRAIQSAVFNNFWRELVTLNKKSEIINQYEIGLSQKLAKGGLTFASLYQSERRTSSSVLKILTEDRFVFFRDLAKRLTERDLYQNLPRKIRNFGNRNPTHTYWQETILDSDSPFVKIELLRDNPTRLSTVENIIPTIEATFDYPTDLITNHLNRHY